MPRPLEFDRTEVLEKAMMVFWEQGFEATSLDDLTAAMNIKRPSLYNSFGDKQSLYLEALKHYQSLSSVRLLSTFDRAPSVMEGFKQMFHDIAYAGDACMGCMVVSAGSELASSNEKVAHLVRSAELRTESVFQELIEKAQANQELDASVNAASTAAILYNTMIGLRSQARSGAAGDKLERIALSVLSMFS